MGGCRCSYKNCKSATKTTENLHFFHYPVKHTERCRKWIENACKPHFFDLAEDQLRNKVVCELHFEERCFTNVSRRRLLHDAIPTLDAGCEDVRPHRTDYHQNQATEEIQVLPANDDGTIFTVDTDSFQQIPVSEKIESYIYSNGALVPLYKTEAGNGEENVVYTLEETNTESEPGSIKSRNGNTLFQNAGKQTPEPRAYRLLFDAFTESEGTESIAVDDDDDDEETSNGTIDSQKKLSISKKMETQVVPKKNANLKAVSKKMLRRVKQHTKDIAFIKKTLIHSNRNHRKLALHSLTYRLPPSLRSLVKRTMQKGESEITEHELELFKEIHTASPSLYNNLKDKYGWKLPDAKTLYGS